MSSCTVWRPLSPLSQIILFGVIICLDSFLYTFTILPLRLITAAYHLLANLYLNTLTRGRRRYLRLSHKCDLTKAAILAGTLFLLHRMTDASKMYHGVRGQDTIKLYVLFNVLEVSAVAPYPNEKRRAESLGAHRSPTASAARLDKIYKTRSSLGKPSVAGRMARTLTFGPSPSLASTWHTSVGHTACIPEDPSTHLAICIVAHTLVLFYQLVTLNVAINSHSNALLTLLLSNQFVEIKGSVFKKFEKENLFQLTCAGRLRDLPYSRHSF